jgi:lysophospholipase L1-like esterase
MSRLFPLLIVAVCAASAFAQSPPPELKDGDRVAFIGSTFIEREGRYGYIETALTRLHPERKITFRNLGWSGDDITGQSRAYFGPPPEGFKHLLTYATAVKPTVLIVCYGGNEAFAGSSGVSEFMKGYESLLDELVKATNARVILMTPPPLEKLGPPLPDPTPQNQNLAIYRDAIRTIAQQRKYGFVDLFQSVLEAKDRPLSPLTINGVHYNELGCRFVAAKIAESFGGKSVTQPLGKATLVIDAAGTARLESIEPGSYAIHEDSKPVGSFEATQPNGVVTIDRGPLADELRTLRQAIVAKNELFFHGYRPANETYLRGFRKHEQGQNAVEIPQFDPLVEKKEDVIATLKKPAKHTFELVGQSGAKP